MNKSHKQILLPVQFAATQTMRLVVQSGPVRRHGAPPLLLKSVPARMAATQTPHPAR